MGDVLFLVLRRLRAPLITLIAVYAIAVVGLVAVPGETPDGQPWRMGFFHAFYVMSYTATTIGFGEIPYPFTDAQRLWVTFSIYLSVIGWAYAIGSVFALSQDATFRSAASRAVFLRRVAGLREPYCVICGYGRSGRAIAHALDAQGARTVVVDLDPARVAGIAIEDFDASPLVLVADARHPDVLRDAGIARPECRAVLALTADDEANQSVAIGTRVLDPATIVIARVTDPAVKSNLRDFGGVTVIDPFESFAHNVGADLAAPEALQLEEWLTGVPGGERPETVRLPKGPWVLAGYGRFGRAVAEALTAAGQSWRAFDPYLPQSASLPQQVRTCASAEEGLRECEVAGAVGLVAGTDDDTMNLGLVTMARRVNPSIAVVVRQHKAYNRALIEAARARLTFVQSDLMTHEVLQALTTPLLNRFLELARRDGAALARLALQRLDAAFGRHVPFVWTFECDPSQPGIRQALYGTADPLRLADLLIDPRDPSGTLNAVPLLLARPGPIPSTGPTRAPGDPEPASTSWRRHLRMTSRQGRAERLLGAAGAAPADEVALPDPQTALRPGDFIMFAGSEGVESLQRRFLLDPSPIEFVRTGAEPPRSWLFRRFARGRRSPSGG